MSRYIEFIEERHLPDRFRIVSELCGIETARILLDKLSGFSIYPPSPHRLNDALKEYVSMRIEEEPDNYIVNKLCNETGASERLIIDIIKQIKEKKNEQN